MVTTYLPTPADAPVVTVTDEATGEDWQAVIHEDVVHDASGVVDGRDIGGRFTITRDGVDISESLADCCDFEAAWPRAHEDECPNYDGAPDA